MNQFNRLQCVVAYVALAISALQPSVVLAQQYKYLKIVPNLTVTGSQTPGGTTPPDVVPPKGTLSVAPVSRSFNNQDINTSSAAQQFTVTNIGSGTLTITGISVDTGIANFGASNNCGAPLPSNGTCQISVSFTPSATGMLAGSLLITNDGSTGTGIATFSGIGVQGVVSQPSTLIFSTVNVGTYFDKTITVANSGLGNLTMSPPEQHIHYR